MEKVIAGKVVVFKDRLPAKENWSLVTMMNKLSGGSVDYEPTVAVLSRIVASWEFEGDPADPASFDDLDLIREFMPLMNAAGEMLNPPQKDDEPKN